MRSIRAVFLVILTLATAFLTGCANTAATRTATGLELDLKPADNKGFVVLKVVSTRPISLLNPKWQSIKINSGTKSDELTDITPTYNMLMGKHVPTESLYFARLDAGEYEVTGMGSIGPGPGLLLALLASDSASADKQLPKFKVEVGRLANLGTLVYSPEIDKEEPSRIFLLNGPMGTQAAKSALLAEAKRSDLALTEGGGWLASANAESEAKVLTQARLMVSMLNFLRGGPTVVAGSQLGQILRRTAVQTWSRESVNTLDRIFSVASTPDGSTVAGGEYGQYFVASGNGTWRTYRLADEAGRIAHIELRSDGSALFVVGDLRQTRVWRKRALLASEETPTLVAKFDAPPDNLLATNKELIVAWNIPGISRTAVLSRIDMETLSVKTQNENFWVVDWQYMPDGKVKLSRQNGRSIYSSSSADGMQTWMHGNESGAFGAFWQDDARGFSLDVSPGFSMVANTLRKTEDGGKSWARSGKPLETRHFAGRIVYADSNEVLIQGGHMLYSSTDQGQTWKRSFPALVK